MKRRSQTGIALIFVLWLLVLLGLLATGYTDTTRSGMMLQAHAMERSQARALAEAGIWKAVQKLLQPSPASSRLANGHPVHFSLNDHVIRVRARDEAGKIDLNIAPAELLDGLFTANGITAQQRRTWIRDILAWRSDARTLQQHEAGNARQPKQGPFNSIDEIRLATGMSPEVFDQLAPALTVYSGQPGINARLAPAAALRALPGFSAAALPDRMAASEDDNVGKSAATELHGVHRRFLSDHAGATYLISSHADMNHTSQAVTAVVTIDREAAVAYRILSWRTD